MPNDLVCDPVKDVENEEGQGKGSSRYRVDSLGPVHKLLLDGVCIFGGLGGRVGRCGLDGCPILHLEAVTHPVTAEIKATFPSSIFFLREGRQRKPSLVVSHRRCKMLNVLQQEKAKSQSAEKWGRLGARVVLFQV